MRSLLKLMLILALIFLSTFVVIKATGWITVEIIEQWLTAAQSASPWILASVVITLLCVDLFIAVPTMTVILLSGYFLGAMIGFIAALLGLLLTGTLGYVISRKFGEKPLSWVIKDETSRNEAKASFQQHGFMTILLSRAMPILPEVSACMAGINQMKFSVFMVAWLISATPYALIIAYAGSISSLNNPKPAILTAITLTGILWACWALFKFKTDRAE